MHQQRNYYLIKFRLIFSSTILMLILMNNRKSDSFNLSPKANLAIHEPPRSKIGFYPVKGRSSYFGLSINLKKQT